MGKEPFLILSISTDNGEEELRKYVAANGMGWPQIWDRNGVLVAKFGVQAFPTYLVVSPEGEVVYAVRGSFRISNALQAVRKGS